MKEIKVRKQELLEKIKYNREEHIKEYNLAHTEWVNTTINFYQEQINSLNSTRKQLNKIPGYEPVSHEKDYDRAIAMLEMCVEEEILLQAQEFNRYVLDEWDWTQTFKTVAATYMKDA